MNELDLIFDDQEYYLTDSEWEEFFTGAVKDEWIPEDEN